MTATVIHRVENGQLAEKWSDKDVLGFCSNSASCRDQATSRLSRAGTR